MDGNVDLPTTPLLQTFTEENETIWQRTLRALPIPEDETLTNEVAHRSDHLSSGTHAHLYRCTFGTQDAAMKVLKLSHTDPPSGEDFAREVVLQHSVITACEVYGYHIDGLRFTMRLCRTSLQRILHEAQHHSLTTEQRMILGAQVIDAVCGIQDAGVVHMDIKPGNLLIDDSCIRVADFGHSCYANSTNTVDHGIRGTPQFMAPETLSLNSTLLTTQADIFSSAAVLYELLDKQYASFNPHDNQGNAMGFMRNRSLITARISVLKRQFGTTANCVGDLFTACFSAKPKERPDAHELKERWADFTQKT